ncbi:MAG: retropepsin-like domain-containing protein [Myxococcales bacterium]|nr:retropepsin-like domain-containing protein [Myxococcales bacterium]
MRSETSYDLDGDLIVIDASLLGPTGRGTVRLVLDTGSTLTTLTPAIAEALGYTSTDRVSRSVVRSAVAEEPGYIVRMAQLSTLGFKLSGVLVNVAELGHEIDGLLGMNVMSNFNLEIRPIEQRIILERLAPAS